MKVLKQGMIAVALAVSTVAFACSIDGKDGFLPENNMYIPANIKNAGGISEAQFNSVIDQISGHYSPIIESMGAKLDVVRNWSDGTVNAYAQQIGKTWRVSMFGGLARHNTITADGFALVLCHEIGHHIGGAPKKTSWGGTSWATNEGQADYFATLKCLRRAWMDDDNAAIIAQMDVPAAVKEQCGAQWTWNRDYNICIRGAMAGVSVSNLFHDGTDKPAPSVTTPDPKVVRSTNHNHPEAQCRLDTYFQGALCHIDHTQDVSMTDEFVGTCNTKTGDATGVRPLCWFKPAE